jgi:hypothetical protein
MFDATSDTSKYPHGVKMSYRAFSAEKVVAIVRDPQHWSSLSMENRYVPTYPLDTDPDGLYILKSLPTCCDIFEPDEFVEDGRRKLEEVKRSIERNYNILKKINLLTRFLCSQSCFSVNKMKLLLV